MSILHSSARPSGASRRSSEVWLREALLAARCAFKQYIHSIKSSDAIGRAQYIGNGDGLLLPIFFELETNNYIHKIAWFTTDTYETSAQSQQIY